MAEDEADEENTTGLTMLNEGDDYERLYTGPGYENLTHKQRRKAARLAANNKQKKLDNFLDRKAPNRADDLNKAATVLAQQRFDDIKARRAKLYAEGGGISDAGQRQLVEGAVTASAQQAASSVEDRIQQHLNSGLPYSVALRLASRDNAADAERAAETAAKASRDGWVAHQAKEAQDFQALDNMTSAFMAQYAEDPNGALAGLAANLAASAPEALSSVMGDYIDKDWEQSRWNLKDQE